MANPPEKVLELVDRFDRNLTAYKQGHYNETQVRLEYLDPFFKALGWDVHNERGYGEAYKDVVHEDAIRIGHAIKAPDYSFRIGGVRKFFLEAKRPSVDIRGDVHPAYQLRRYAWSAKLPLSILTDFEEFAVYDCRSKPNKADNPSHSRILYIEFTEYPHRWDEIAGIFSREAILKGSFDRYAEEKRARRGTAEVDKAFLQEIERWRELLARNIALRNRALSQREINFAVQRTIDRIIFLRICEDRGIEPYGQLMVLQGGTGVYPRLFENFRRADDRYNSGLFHFRREKGRPGDPVDALTPDLNIDDKVLKDLLKNLYYPDSPYEFSVLPADILGQVYEQFLGRVIRLTKAHRAVVEEKPEVKKAGGVYYTPTYIVDHIVRQTAGKLLEGKKPGPRGAASRLRILDPACGSGSFLLGAFQFLLDWHRDAYVEGGTGRWAKGRKPRIYQASGGDWRLTTDEKKRILLNNIYGVDIDPQAVEVTKLSLLLKVLEGESQETLSAQLSLFRERALPDLGHNIKCGNSLIGPDFYEGKQISLLDDAEVYRINAFDWNAEFPEIMKAGGFDAVIGNPPYIRIQTMKQWAPVEVEHYKTAFRSARKGNYDIYVVFTEKGLGLLNDRGLLGFILPHKFFNAKYGEGLRECLASGKHLARIVHFGDQQVFEGATNYTCLLFLDRSGRDRFHCVQVKDLAEWRRTGQSAEGKIRCSRAGAAEWNFVVGKGARLFDRLSEMPVKLGDVARLFVGLQTNADDVFILKEVRRDKGRALCESKSTGRQHWFEAEHLKPFLKGSLDIRRYCLAGVTKRLIFPYEHREGTSVLIQTSEYKRRFPLTWAYLEENRERLAARDRGDMGREWYGYVYRKNHTRFGAPKLLVPSIATGSCFAADLNGTYYFVGSGGGGGGGYGIILREEANLSYPYLLGLLNSRLLSTYLKSISTSFRGGYIALNRQYIEQLPIRTIRLSNRAEEPHHDGIVELVEKMLTLHEQLTGSTTDHEKTAIQRQIETVDRQIDQLVYELYGLTDKEIRIVEEGISR